VRSTRLLIDDFVHRPEIVDFGGLAGPGRPGNLPKRWGAKSPTFLEGRPPGAPQGLKIDDLRSVKKSYIENLGVSRLCLEGFLLDPLRGRAVDSAPAPTLAARSGVLVPIGAGPGRDPHEEAEHSKA